MPDNESKYFGRKYQILVSGPSGDAIDVSDLHCRFEIEKLSNQTASWADIVVYNMAAETERAIIKPGNKVIVSAGYEQGAYGKIFEGDLYQPMWERENVIDYKVTLACLDGDSFMNGNFVKYVEGQGYKYSDIVRNMARNARTPIPVGAITEKLDATSAPRGKVIFGDPRDIMRNICIGNNATFFSDNNRLYVAKIDDAPKGNALVVSPETGLIGTPQQTDKGFSFRCLLNPLIKAIDGTDAQMYVKIDNSAIRQEKVRQGQNQSRLDLDLEGKVIGVVYTGDNRGDEWYCDVTCVAKGGSIPWQLQQ